MKKIIAFLSVIAFTLVITACGGGGPGPAPTPTGGSGTAAQYFTKTAVGNTWEWTGLITPLPGFLGSVWFYDAITETITSSAGGVVTVAMRDSPWMPTKVYTMQINQSGEWAVTGPGGTYALLPAAFSVGTTWAFPAGAVTRGPLTFKVAGLNVTRTVPAGTFTDCLQLDWVQSDPVNPATTIASGSFYFSPTAGSMVDATGTYFVLGTSVATGTLKLQRYVAN